MEEVEVMGNEEEKAGIGIAKKEPTRQEGNTLPVLYVNSLLTIETCGYFEASHKRRYPTKEKPSKVITIGKNHLVEFIPTQKYGYPNSDDLDFKRAFDRICDEQSRKVERVNKDGATTYHYHLQQPIRVPTKRLLRYAGRAVSARELKAVRSFLERNSATSIKGELQDPKTREYGEVFFSLFSQIAVKGEQMKDGTTAETNLVWLSPYALRCYYWRLTRKEDISFHHRLTKAISKVLYPYLDSGWFAALAAGGDILHRKSYLSLCDLLSLPRYKYLSDIRRQLDPSHDELKAQGYLDRWEYRKRENKDPLIYWSPGKKWFQDLKARGHDTPRLGGPATKSPKDPLQEAKADILVEDILSTLQDEHSRHFYQKVAHKLPEHEIHRMLSEIKADIINNPASTIRNPAAVFTARAYTIAHDLGVDL